MEKSNRSKLHTPSGNRTSTVTRLRVYSRATSRVDQITSHRLPAIRSYVHHVHLLNAEGT